MPVSAVEGNDTGSVTVATFTTPDLNSQAGDFTATVSWGDGTTDMASVSGGNGSFTVTDDHTYAEKGSYPVTVQISDTVTGGSASASTTATVTDAPLTLTGGFQLGDAMSNPPNSFTVATFTDANPNAPLSDYTALIDWGDGNKSQGYIENAGDGVYLIVAPHNYTLPFGTPGPLTRTVTVTLSDVDGASASTTSTVVVGQLQAGVPVTMGELQFMDANTYAKASDFVAQGQTGVALINWGDGTSSLGTVSGGPGNGSGPQPFTITGVHTYAQDSYDQPNGQYAVTATVTDVDGNVLTGTQYVSVVRPPMAGNGDAIEGQPGVALNNVQVAEFAVPATSDTVSEFSATINWGDSTSSNGTIQEVTPGLLEVLGSHTYTTVGAFVIQATVSQDWIYPLPAMLFSSTALMAQGNPYKLSLVIEGPVVGGTSRAVEVQFAPAIPRADIVNPGEIQVIDSSTGQVLPYLDSPIPYLFPTGNPPKGPAKGLVAGISWPSGFTSTIANKGKAPPQLLLLPDKVEVKLVGATIKNGAGKVVPLVPTPLTLTVQSPDAVGVPTQLKLTVLSAKEEVGVLRVGYGINKVGKGQFPTIAAIFNIAGKPTNVQGAAKQFAANGDHFNWYQVITEDRERPSFKVGNDFFQLTTPYVDGPPGGYFYPKEEKPDTFDPSGPTFDKLPWYYNDGGFDKTSASITWYMNSSAVGFYDRPGSLALTLLALRHG